MTDDGSPAVESPAFSHDPWVQIFIDPDESGGAGFIRIVESGGIPGVAILPISGDRIGLVTNRRRPIKCDSLEIPRGFGGDSATSAEDAVRELVEETGIQFDDKVDSLRRIGSVWPNNGLLAAEPILYVVLIGRNQPSSPRDTAEIKKFSWYELDDVMRLIAADKIKDSFTHSAVLRAVLMGYIDASRLDRGATPSKIRVRPQASDLRAEDSSSDLRIE
ncbi:NUDIX hydrolase [Pseudonocardia humida]|uniref:NUDIX domain-containing protein n=1 Tax=Pseudonocardia humida TaxID=2800819 RepID=A0ABT1A523_9PSEU|nr:NUDIX domain-containing protein [Pseudonocardia humida]MCO1658108.1 NUDIX domain-containing protein [Pseudonocardia humida]